LTEEVKWERGWVIFELVILYWITALVQFGDDRIGESVGGCRCSLRDSAIYGQLIFAI